MVKKDRKWEWTEKQKETFEELKKRFTQELVLAAPDLDKKMRMEVDASDYATEMCCQWREKMGSRDQLLFSQSL